MLSYKVTNCFPLFQHVKERTYSNSFELFFITNPPFPARNEAEGHQIDI